MKSPIQLRSSPPHSPSDARGMAAAWQSGSCDRGCRRVDIPKPDRPSRPHDGETHGWFDHPK